MKQIFIYIDMLQRRIYLFKNQNNKTYLEYFNISTLSKAKNQFEIIFKEEKF